MQIAHIFNEVKPKDETTSIDVQPFDMEYWKKSREDYKPKDIKSLKDDFSKKYYYSLYPQKGEDKTISKYDYDKIKRLTSDEELGSDLLLISGDFWGIQKFIFDGITTSKASKILRSRSAMVQLITYAVVDRIKKEFKGSDTLLFGAGKFMILAKNEDRYGIGGFSPEKDEAKAVVSKLDKVQKELDSYFLKSFFGQNGFILSSQKITKDKLTNQKESMEEDLDALSRDNERKKLNKFDLLNCSDSDILIDQLKEITITDNTSCKFCNKRIETNRVDEETKACKVCFYQIELGKKLTKNRYVSIFNSSKLEIKENIEIIKFGNIYYYASFSNDLNNLKGEVFDISSDKFFDYPKWSLNSYVNKYDNNEIISFSAYLNEDNREDGKVISSGLMALKADIDKLGDTFRELYKEDFKKFNRLSREVEFFFSDYITSLLEDKNIYTVFAGGDDLFIIGEYQEIVQIAKDIRTEFLKFSLGKTKISMGLVMFKPTTPITFVSDMADKAEKRAKIERDSIDIFGVSMKFEEFTKIENDFKEVTDFLEKENDDKTSFYYRIIELCDMKSNIKQDIRNAMWKSKLNYLFRRNVKREYNDSRIFNLLNELIEKGEKFKPSIFLKIYQNRDKKKENRDD